MISNGDLVENSKQTKRKEKIYAKQFSVQKLLHIKIKAINTQLGNVCIYFVWNLLICLEKESLLIPC